VSRGLGLLAEENAKASLQEICPSPRLRIPPTRFDSHGFHFDLP